MSERMTTTEREIEAAGGSVGVKVERRGAVAIWTIDRADRRNALSRAVVRERRLKPWKTKPSVRLRNSARASLSMWATFSPARK